MAIVTLAAQTFHKGGCKANVPVKSKKARGCVLIDLFEEEVAAEGEGAAGGEGADGGEGAVGGVGADGGEGAAGGEGADGGEGAVGGVGADGGEGAVGGEGADGVEGGNGGEGADGEDGPGDQAFKYVLFLLRTSSGHRTRRYAVSVEELRRRTAPPESASLNTLTALLRVDKRKKEELRDDLRGMGVIPGAATRVTSMCSKMTEGEAADLCMSVGTMASKGIKFNQVFMFSEEEDPTVSLGKAVEFRNTLKRLVGEIHRNGEDFARLTHTLGPGMLDTVADIIDHCVSTTISKLN